MALKTVDQVVGLGNIIPASSGELTRTDATLQHLLGILTFMVDRLGGGLRVFRYVRLMQSGGMARGELCQRVAVVTGTVTAATGEVNDTTHLADTSNFTAGDEEGKLCQINVAGAAAPEGEVALIVDSTASQLTFDGSYALSAAPASADTYSDWGVAHCDDAAASTLAINVGGIVMGVPAAKDYGWAQIYGIHPAVNVVTTGGAPTIGAAGVPGAVGVLVRGSETPESYIGHFLMATSTTAVQAAFFIDLWNKSHPIA